MSRSLVAALVALARAYAARVALPRRRAAAGARAQFGFGKPATPEEIAGWDIDVRPDGTGLPPGRGTVARGAGDLRRQVRELPRHVRREQQLPADRRAAWARSAPTQPMRTTGSKLNYATTLFDYIRRAMPFDAPQSLTADEVYALTAYVLNLNDIVPADAALDQDSLPKCKMPNRDGFTTAHGLMRARRQARHRATSHA